MNAYSDRRRASLEVRRKFAGVVVPLVVACGAMWLTAGCSKSADKAGAAAAAKAKEERYPIRGEVLRVEADRKILIVKHEEIKGFMPAMTMEFLASPGDIAVAKPGQRIRAEMVPDKDGEYRLEKIWPDDKAAADAVAAGALQLRQDTHTRGKLPYREVGEAAPDFALFDQSGRVVQMSRFRGKQIMLNFIFTRCPIANMCPAATEKMVNVQKLAREAGIPNLELISITMDPAYDTPGVLKEYADARGIDTKNFSLLTGPENAIKDLLAQFGVIAEFEGDLLKHTLTTLLINADGKIIHRAEGKVWEPKDFIAKMKKA